MRPYFVFLHLTLESVWITREAKAAVEIVCCKAKGGSVQVKAISFPGRLKGTSTELLFIDGSPSF